MKLKITPGDWSFGKEVSYGRDINAEGRWIGTAHNSHGYPDPNKRKFPTSEECEANAHLISAAPEMYGLLEQLRLSSYYCIFCGNSVPKGHTPDCKLAAVLRKAEGK